MKDSGSISFIIPTFNASKHLECCLASIRSQDYPQEKIEILVLDGGSTDGTRDIARRFSCEILDNVNKLAEYGVQLGVLHAKGEFLVVFAADNELIGKDWVSKVISVFGDDKSISAVWGRLASGKDDPPLNKYFELIQSDPLNWFLNHNLSEYIRGNKKDSDSMCKFSVDPHKPLVWGANGLTYRRDKIRKIWDRAGYFGDNDAFQSMVEQGNNKVAYFDSPFVYHHHIANLKEWQNKWKRNFVNHLLDKKNTRNMNWALSKNFKIKLLLWLVYSLIPIFSFFQSCIYLVKDKKIYWLYHPVVSFMQTWTYLSIVIGKRNNLKLTLDLISGK